MLLLQRDLLTSPTLSRLTETSPTRKMGRIIGKQGRIAKAIRTIARSASIRTEEKVMVEID